MVRRRAFIFGGVSAAVAVFNPACHQPARKYYGTLTVDGWNIHHRQTGKELAVLLDGVDVTRECKRANDRKGYVVIRNREQHAGLHVDGVWKVHRGRVEIIERDGRG